MKKFIPRCFLALCCLALLMACKPEAKPEDKGILYYTCSMHPFVHKDHPGPCPVCGMPLVPKYRNAEIPGQTSDVSGRGEVSLSSEKKQWIGVKTEPVALKPITRAIRTSGTVAFDPDLYVAQNDYLLAKRTGGGSLGGLQASLIKAAKDRLVLLGMGEDEIRDLEKKGRATSALVVPDRGQDLWVYGSLFEQDLPFVHRGTPVKILFPGNNENLESSVDSISPTIDPNTRTAKFRMKLKAGATNLRPDSFVQLDIQAGGEPVLAIPTGAVIDTGREKIAYVQTQTGSYEPRSLKIGRYGSEVVEVLSGLKEGELVVTQGNFLLDSESSLGSVGK